jgi:hypothetical protein
MQIFTSHYDDFKRFVTGVGAPPPPAFDPATGKPIAPIDPLTGKPVSPPVDPLDGHPVSADAPKSAQPKAQAHADAKMKGLVYQWGGTPATGNWGCALISAEHDIVIWSTSTGPSAPPTFAADFPEAIQLENQFTISR